MKLQLEHIKQQFISEGLVHVYEWKDEPGVCYPEHAHQGRVSLYIVSGSVSFSGDFDKTLVSGDRFDVPIGAKHSAIVGPEGCEYVVGEEMEGDS